MHESYTRWLNSYENLQPIKNHPDEQSPITLTLKLIKKNYIFWLYLLKSLIMLIVEEILPFPCLLL